MPINDRLITFRGPQGRPFPTRLSWDGESQTVTIYPSTHSETNPKSPHARIELSPEEVVAFATALVDPIPKMAPIQDQIAEWSKETFGSENVDAVLSHLDEEHDELYDAIKRPRPGGVAEELADMAILLYKIAALMSVDLDEAVQDKHGINTNRSWGPSGPNGVRHHIPEPVS